MPDRADRLSRLVRSRPAALALIVLGVIAIVAGLLQTTTSHLNGGNVPCPNGTTLVAKFDFGGGKYHFEEPAGNEHVVTITHGYLFEVCVSRASLARAGSGWSCSDRYRSTWWACN